jgi:hypothetical protein
MGTWEARHVSVAIERPPGAVYEFVANPANLTRWAAGLARTIREVDGAWIVDSPMGQVTVRFAGKNAFGVVDHDVTLPDGQAVHNPLRVLANGDGSEVIFTLYRRPGVSADAFIEDAAAVARDLRTLKTLLEG